MTKSQIHKIGVLTSGGDSPGMNAAIRAVVRTALQHNLEVSGIYNGYEGMMNDQFVKMDTHSVSGIISRGGTILKTARSKRFRTDEGLKTGYENLMREGIEGLVVIGGDGTFRGALEFGKKYDIPIMGLPGTIDNDLTGTDLTIGFDTALNTVIEAVDKIRDTAASHNRIFFIEVMGRDAGYIALHSGIATGAEGILIPETKTTVEEVIDGLADGLKKRNSRSAIVIVSEGDEAGGALEIANRVKQKYEYFDTRVTILGHIQRGGSPSCRDRVLATELGFDAVKALLNGRRGEMVGIINNKIAYTPFEKATKQEQAIDQNMLDLAKTLSMLF